MKKSYFKYLLSMLIFSTNGIVASFIKLSGLELILWRLIIGTTALLLVFVASGRKFTVKKYPKDTLLVCASGVFMALNWVLLFTAYNRIGVSLASLLNYSAPVYIMMLSPIFFNEKLTGARITGFAAVIVGIILVNGIDGTRIEPLGFTIALLGAVAYATLIIINKKAVNIKGIESTLLQMISALVTVFVFALIKHSVVLPPDLKSTAWILELGIVNTAFACVIYFSSIGELPAQTVSVCSYLDPLFAVILSTVILGEKMTVLQVVGGVFILGGALYSEIKSLSPPAKQK